MLDRQQFTKKEIGQKAFQLAQEMWAYNRSLTGEGVRRTLRHIQNEIPALKIHSVPSGTSAFDWTIPKEWNVKEAWIITPDGEKIANFSQNNLHLLGYSTPVSKELSLQELEQHLYSLPELPEAIPYITSYYQERWGFCISQKQRECLKDGIYKVHIDSELKEGVLNYGELHIKGRQEKECLLSTYICHPMMANNELSGPVVATAIAQWLITHQDTLEYSYRILFAPETIGSIYYISKHLAELKDKVKAGYVLTCIGDDRAYSYLASRMGDSLSDHIARHCMKHISPDFIEYTFMDRGSDERQFCAPGVDLPIASLMRTRYGSYPEYHTSLDTLGDVVTPDGLQGGIYAVMSCIETFEKNKTYKTNILCEPQLGKRGLYPTLSLRDSNTYVSRMMDILAYSDGQHSLLAIAEKIGCPVWELYEIADTLEKEKVITPTPKMT